MAYKKTHDRLFFGVDANDIEKLFNRLILLLDFMEKTPLTKAKKVRYDAMLMKYVANITALIAKEKNREKTNPSHYSDHQLNEIQKQIEQLIQKKIVKSTVRESNSKYPQLSPEQVESYLTKIKEKGWVEGSYGLSSGAISQLMAQMYRPQKK